MEVVVGGGVFEQMRDETCVCLHCCWIYSRRAVVAALRSDWSGDVARGDVTGSEPATV